MTDPVHGSGSRSRIDRARWLAHLALLVERIWPVVLPLACLVALFFAFAWFGIFALLGFAARLGLIGLLVALGLLTLWRNRGLSLPRRTDAEARIEAASRLSHQPLRVQGDRVSGTDDVSAALWREHQRRMAERLGTLSSGTPRTATERLDPYGLRALVALLLVTGFAYSYGPGGGRVADALAPGMGGAEALAARVDAWVTPPGYTGRPPIFLAGAGALERQAEGDAPVVVPTGSVLSVRISDAAGVDLMFSPDRADGETRTIPAEGEVVEGAPTDAEADVDPAPAEGDVAEENETDASVAGGPREFALVLTEDGSASLSSTFTDLGEWHFAVTPDTPPTVAFVEAPSAARNGALEFTYAASDDYRVRGIEAEMSVAENDLVVRPLIAPPDLRIAVPRRPRAGDGDGAPEARFSADLTDSPYAGAEVALTLVAQDDAEQKGRSQTQRFTLPERYFREPLARALVEQRRILAMNADAADRVVELLDAVMLRGEEFVESPGTHVALSAVRSRIANAYTDEQLVSAVDFLWEIALAVEDGDLSLAERRLRDAREQLSDALENGASDEEIQALMEELRQAMREYMEALAEAMRQQGPMDQSQAGNAQELRPQDLERMMDRIEDLARSGSREAAQQLLSEFQRMMDNLQAMQPGQQQQQDQAGPMQEQMNKMGELLQRQQELMDQTFDLGRQRLRQEEQRRQEQGEPQMPPPFGEPQLPPPFGQFPPPMGQSPFGQQQPQPPQQGEAPEGEEGESPPPMTAEELQQRLEQLRAQQGQLQQELEAMQEALEGMGMEPSEGFGEAGEAMGNAEGALGEGEDGTAVGEQGRALDALRRGAQDAMQQMQQAMEGEGGSPGAQPGPGGQGQSGRPQQSGRDPLGRQLQSDGNQFGQDLGIPDEIDTQRARQILDAIRERLGDTLSPQLEREYLERLLRTQ